MKKDVDAFGEKRLIKVKMILNLIISISPRKNAPRIGDVLESNILEQNMGLVHVLSFVWMQFMQALLRTNTEGLPTLFCEKLQVGGHVDISKGPSTLVLKANR